MSDWQGMNWIRKDKRLAIYLRDGMACGYCGSGFEEEIRFTLDHLIPRSLGGDNSASNLLTCCNKCNSTRQAREWQEFAKDVAVYLDGGVSGEMIIERIETVRHMNLTPFRQEARAILERRATFAGALSEASEG